MLLIRKDGVRFYCSAGSRVAAELPAANEYGGYSKMRTEARDATVVFVHPERRFLVVEVQGAPVFAGKGRRYTIRYTIWPEQIRLKRKKTKRK